MGVTQLSIIMRPRKFSDIYNQEGVVKELKARQTSGDWPTAMLMKGPSGTGKTTAAHLVAMTLVCKSLTKEGDPCCECVACKSIIEERFDRDVVVLDGSSFSGKDDVVDFGQIADSAPMYDKKKILIIEEADQLSAQAKSAMLKILEKPRSHVHFILLSMFNTGIPTAIQSRCQTFNFKPFNTKDIMIALKGILEKMNLWNDKSIPDSFKLAGLASIAGSARGSLREGVQYLEKCLVGKYYTVEEIKSNLGIIDESTINGTLMKLLNRDLTFFTDIADLNIEDFFDIAYSALVDAYVYGMTGYTKNEYYEASTKAMAKSPGLRELLVVMDDLSKETKPYLRKAYFLSKMANWFSKSNAIRPMVEQTPLTRQEQFDKEFHERNVEIIGVRPPRSMRND